MLKPMLDSMSARTCTSAYSPPAATPTLCSASRCRRVGISVPRTSRSCLIYETANQLPPPGTSLISSSPWSCCFISAALVMLARTMPAALSSCAAWARRPQDLLDDFLFAARFCIFSHRALLSVEWMLAPMTLRVVPLL